MPTITGKQILEKHEAQRKASEGKFIPFEGEEYDVTVKREDPVEIPEGEYTFYQYRVIHNGKEKMWRLFLNQAADLETILAKRPERNVHVQRPRGSKKLNIT